LDQLKEREGFASFLFHKLFYFEIFRKLRVGTVTGQNLFQDRKPPVPFTLEKALTLNEQPRQPSGTERLLADQKILSVKQTTEIFLKSTAALKSRSEQAPVEFDKDDTDVMDFVSSASNLRSYIFDIPVQSRFENKSAAGNIIPAIATTNAIIAGLIVMEAFKILKGKLDESRNISLFKKPSAGRLLVSQKPDVQNANCYVCSNKFISVKVNTNTTTLGHFVDKILKEKLGFNAPSVILQSNILYENGEGMDEYEVAQMNKQLKKVLHDVKINHNTILDIDDDSQDFKLQISILHSETFSEDQTFEIIGKAEPSTTVAKLSKPIDSKMEEEEGEVMIVEAPVMKPPTPKRKRRREEEEEENKKKVKTDSGKVIELD